MSSQRQRQSRWRISLVLLVFLGLIRSGELASASVPSETSPTTSSLKRKSQDIGSLSDFTWQAWLLVDTQAGIQPGIDSTTLLRRITPKSVFIAPALPACAEGYRADAMGRCVKSVNIDENAHINFLLERLNALYGNQGGASQAAASKSSEKKSTGPLQLNIPLVPDSDTQSTKIGNPEQDSLSTSDGPMVVPARNETRPGEEERTKPRDDQAPTVRAPVHEEAKNDTSSEEEGTTFPPGNPSNADDNEPERRNRTDGATAAPIAESLDERNDTNSAEIVDYKTPIDLKALLNTSGIKKLDVSDVTAEGTATEERRDNFTQQLSPTLVLLLSPTKVMPSVIPPHTAINDNVTTLALTRPHYNATADHAPVSDLILNATTIEDIITGDMADTVHDATSTKELQPEALQPIVVNEHARSNETDAGKKSTPDNAAATRNPSLRESQETEFIYDDDDDEEEEEYTYSTDVPEEEESTEVEGEEILKHGEAGMTFPTRNVERLRAQQQQQTNETATDRKTTLGTDADQHSLIRFNDSALVEDKDETGSNISSEVSIDGDLILETTLLDVNTESLLITTKSPDAVVRKLAESSGNDDRKESFGESPVSEQRDVVFSQESMSRDTVSSTTAGLPGRKRTEHFNSSRAENEENEEPPHPEAAPSSPKPPLSSGDHPAKDGPAEKRTEVDKKQSDVIKGLPLRARAGNLHLDVPASTPMRFTAATNLDHTTDHANRANFPGYVRFPSSEVNSIHSPSYKQHSLYPSDDLGSYDSTSTKSSVPVRQKPVYYLAAPSSKPDRPQSDRVAATATASERQKQSPMLLRFWSKMPLVRDPAIYPADRIPDSEAIDDTRKQPRDRFLRTLSSRRAADFHTESARKNINRLLAQKHGTPIDG